MGVINLTPDSFSDGGRFVQPERAFTQAKRLVSQGVDILDLGAQSTRPGARELSAEQEWDRLEQTLKLILAARKDGQLCCSTGRNSPHVQNQPLISIDTFRASVAEAALSAGADWINDVSGGRHDREMFPLVADRGCPYVLMHSRGNSCSMDDLVDYAHGDVVQAVINELQAATDQALAAGVRPEQLIWDPGLGFAKTNTQNLDLLAGLPQLLAQGFPLLVGPSRKRFIGAVLDEPKPKARIWGTAAVVAHCVAAGVHIVRVHDGKPIVEVVRMSQALKMGLRADRS